MPPPDSPLTALRAYLAWDDACPECLGRLDSSFFCTVCSFDAVDDAANLRLNEDDLRGLAGLED